MQVKELVKTEPLLSFHFEESLKKIIQDTLPDNTLLHTNAGYFAVPSELLKIIGLDLAFEPLEQEFMRNQRIIIGRILDIKSLTAIRTKQFTYELIKEECTWIKYFLGIVSTHLNNREVEGVKLTNHNNIRMLIGEIVQSIEEIDCLTNGLSNFNEGHLAYLKETISRVCNHLAKSAGGRAFLSNGIIEMKCTFDILNHIYLC